jgi:plasmid stability protein
MIAGTDQENYLRHVVRHLEEIVKERLKRRAARHGRSMEEEVRHILRDAVKTNAHPVAKLGHELRHVLPTWV